MDCHRVQQAITPSPSRVRFGRVFVFGRPTSDTFRVSLRVQFLSSSQWLYYLKRVPIHEKTQGGLLGRPWPETLAVRCRTLTDWQDVRSF